MIVRSIGFRRDSAGGSWRHTRITLKPANPDYPPIVLSPDQGERLQVVAELVEVLRAAGEFTIRMPRQATLADAVFAAPGFALRAFAWTPEQKVLAVAPGGGTLEIVPLSPTAEDGDAFQTLLFQNGSLLPFPQLVNWVRTQGLTVDAGGPLVAPNVAAGEYSICMGPPGFPPGGDAQAWAGSARCRTQALSEGGTSGSSSRKAAPGRRNDQVLLCSPTAHEACGRKRRKGRLAAQSALRGSPRSLAGTRQVTR